MMRRSRSIAARACRSSRSWHRRQADDRAGGLAHAAGIELVGEDEAAIAVGGTHHHRHRVDDAQQQFVAFAQRVLVAALLDHDLLFERGRVRGERNLLAPQGQEIARAHAEFVVIDRALQEIGGARGERFQAQRAVRRCRKRHDRHLGAARQGAEMADERDPAEPGQLEVGDEQIGRRALGGSQRILGALVGRDLELRVERARQPIQNLEIGLVVVDDRDGLALRKRIHPGGGSKHCRR